MMICLDPYSILEEERDRLRAQLAEKEREIASARGEIAKLRESDKRSEQLRKLAKGDAIQARTERNRAEAALAAAKARADRAEERVRELLSALEEDAEINSTRNIREIATHLQSLREKDKRIAELEAATSGGAM